MVHKGIVAVLVAVCAYQARYTINFELSTFTMRIPGWIGVNCAPGTSRAVLCKECYPPSSHWTDPKQPEPAFAKVPWNCRSFASASTGTPWQSSSMSRYFRPLHWIPLSLCFGAGYLAYLRYSYIRKREKAKLATSDDLTEFLASNFEVSLYKMLPLKAASRALGKINEIPLPTWARTSMLGAFARSYGCKIEEAEEEDLTKYRNLSEFFRRGLKPGLRPVCSGNCVVSPADGTVLHFGKVIDGQLEQVKGINYSLSSFLGPQTWNENNPKEIDSKNYQKSLLQNKDTELYHFIVYLAPGDYHRFHSAADWQATYRRHFPGQLLSVRPGLLSWIAGLFNINERVAYVGQWEHGFFSMVAVGATNVGSIKVYCDKDLATNCWRQKCGTQHDLSLTLNNNNGVDFKKGEAFGEFNFGSTMVVVFEAPKDFEFSVEPGQKIKYGQLLSKASAAATASSKATAQQIALKS